jgi:hypothetical protein
MADIFDRMADAWEGEVVARQAIGRFTGGAVAPQTAANFDAQGKGVSGRFKIGRKVVYGKYMLAEWLRARAEA